MLHRTATFLPRWGSVINARRRQVPVDLSGQVSISPLFSLHIQGLMAGSVAVSEDT